MPYYFCHFISRLFDLYVRLPIFKKFLLPGIVMFVSLARSPLNRSKALHSVLAANFVILCGLLGLGT